MYERLRDSALLFLESDDGPERATFSLTQRQVAYVVFCMFIAAGALQDVHSQFDPEDDSPERQFILDMLAKAIVVDKELGEEIRRGVLDLLLNQTNQG